MKLHYMGKFSGDEAGLPHGEHRPGAVPFREAKDVKTLAAIANGTSIVIMVLLTVPTALRWEMSLFTAPALLGALASLAVLFPHELLHAVCFRGDVYLYTNWSQGMVFVVGPEEMSKARFVFMSLLPNLAFGIFPYLLGMVTGSPFLLILGILASGMGAGDYYNVFNALTQMPKRAKTYLYQFHSYWFLPETKKAESC